MNAFPFQDEESAIKFRAVAEAYEVLGNVNLKKMYDKGNTLSQILSIGSVIKQTMCKTRQIFL